MPAEVEAACRDSLRCASIFGDLMHCRALIVLTLVLPAVLAGQSPPTPELPNAVMLQFVRFADIFGRRLVAAFDSIPAVRYDYRPTPSQQTIRDASGAVSGLVLHQYGRDRPAKKHRS